MVQKLKIGQEMKNSVIALVTCSQVDLIQMHKLHVELVRLVS